MSGGTHFLVAIDGSGCSWAAWDAVMYLTNPATDTVSTITVMSKVEAEKASSFDNPADNKYHTEKIQKELSGANTGLPEERLKIKVLKKSDKKSREQIIDHAIGDKADVLATGIRGRKGEKGMTGQNIMGGTTDFSLREFPGTSIIVKGNWEKPETGKAVFVVGVDGSQNSRKGYENARSLMKPGDKLHVVHIKSINEDESKMPKEFSSEFIKTRYTAELKDDPDATFHLRENADVPDTLCEFITEVKADFMCIGADGMKALVTNKPIMGSVSDKMVKMADCACIVSQINTVE